MFYFVWGGFMKRFYWLVFLFSFGAIYLLQAQSLGHEWINPSQQYFKIKVVQNGLYRLNFNDLRNTGLPTNLDPTAFQIFRKGIEQAIVVQGEEDKKFDEQDYLEFYGEGNDGQLDSLLYSPYNAQPHSYYSAFTDTASYFLTWRLDGVKGKRMAFYQETNTNNLSPEPYHLEENLQVFHVGYYHGLVYPQGLNNGTIYSNYDFGEGWTGPELQTGQVNAYTFRLENLFASGPKPRAELLLVGINAARHDVEFRAGPSSNQTRLLGNTQFDYQANQKFATDLNLSDVAPDGSLTLTTTSKGTFNAEDLYAVSYLRFKYPQGFVMSGNAKAFNLLPKSGNKSYIEISNVPEGVSLYDLSESNTPVRVGFSLKNNVLQTVIQQTNVGRKLWLNKGVLLPISIQKITFRNLGNKANYLIISHPSLRKPIGNTTDPVKAYASYRATKAGGSYDTLTVDVQQLYDLFSYGDKHVLAIRRFADYMVRNAKSQFLFLIGQPYDPPLARYAPQFFRQDIVPTGGYPASDWVMTMGINDLPAYMPGIAVGRLNTDTPQGLVNYLNKVREHEATPMGELWHKNVLHLSGGQTAGELFTFKGYLNDFKNTAENQQLVVKVTSISKRTDDPVEFLNVTKQVNDGVGLITFFGHSGPNIADIDIGLVSNDLLGYKNKGKYPAIIMNGCDAGSIFAGRNSFGKDWLNTADRGAILFLAGTFLGYPTPLRNYSETLYRLMFADTNYLAKPFGTILMENIRRFMPNNPTFFETTLAQQFTLQGDPAVAVYPATKPDFAVDKNSLFLKAFGNGEIVAAADSFRLGVIVSNLGRVSKLPMLISLKRTLNDGSIIDLGRFTKPAVMYQDTLFFTIKNAGLSVGGTNRFEAIIDPDNQADELNETNNKATFDYLISGYAATPLFPATYGVINTIENNVPTATLTAQVVATFAGESKNYLFELDSTAAFNSSFRKTQTVRSDFLPLWKTSLLSRDSTIYYWRVRDTDHPLGNDNLWAESSFTFIRNMPDGWSQGQEAQFRSVDKDRISFQNNRWMFPESSLKMYVKVLGNDVQRRAYQQNLIFLNNVVLITGGNCGDNSLNLVAFKKGTLKPYILESFPICGNPPFAANTLSDENLLITNTLAQYIDAIPKGDFVLLTSAGLVSFEQWTPTMRQKLGELGIDTEKLKSLKSGAPYLVLGQKGAKKILVEVLPKSVPSPTNETLLLENYDLTDRQTEGILTSTTIGPASAWGNVFLNIAKTSSSQKDTLTIIGVSLQGVENVLFTGVATKFDLTTINPKQYPYLKLRLRLSDKENSQAPQLSRWLVTYTGVPEGVLTLASVGKNGYKIAPKDEGEGFSLNFTFKNISPRPFPDSVLVRQTFFNRSTGKQVITDLKTKRLAIGDSIKINVPIKTSGLGGDNVLSVFFNPIAQAEQYFNNNAVEVPFRVNPDRANPILEVTFDGTQIRNGDLVSANPLIQVRLKDENRFLIRKDTVGIDLFWQRPCQGCQLERIRFRNNPDLRWTAGLDNDFRIEFTPKNLSDGLYKLQTQGRDLSGNAAGAVPYSINFRVQNQAEIKAFSVYPNPMSLFTRFALTLTGSEKPDEFSLRIFDMVGHLVREFTLTDTPLRIGTNDVLWDVKDQNGVVLPNGLYMYRLVVRNKGQNLPLGNETDKLEGRIWVLR